MWEQLKSEQKPLKETTWKELPITKYDNSQPVTIRTKQQARNKLNYLFDRGNISNDEFICAICGKTPIEKHHENYDMWFCFIPLCKKCYTIYNNGQ